MKDDSQPAWQAALLTLLRDNPEGISEYDLLKRLDEDPAHDFSSGDLSDSLNLFQTHFLLFHVLYRLQDRLVASGEGYLEISAMRIRLLPLREITDAQLAAADPLYDYYLDLNNLDETGRADVEDMLGRFWQRYIVQDHRAEYLAVLELEADADIQAIRAQYRRLAMQHHPDRGGDKERLQAINQAYAALTGKSA